MTEGGTILTLTYAGSNRVVPNYNVMGVAKAALEATVRYLANDMGPQGIRVNGVNADRIRSGIVTDEMIAARSAARGVSEAAYMSGNLLGREVEYVQIQGQDHHILDHDQRIVWNDTILAYFARYLKERPEWWNALYPDK